jgi:ATP-dependent DNA helicase RecQ
MSTHNLDWSTIQAAFQKHWGYADFRPPQGEVIRSLLEPRDALVVMPTGGGKSICFQLPALLQRGLTLVVSPLVALMENQVRELQQRQLPAGVLHSEQPTHLRKQILWALKNQALRLLYLSPETLLSSSVWDCLCQPQVQINGLILDEAHCLVQWGETFRPAYRRLGAVRSALLQTKPAGTKIAIAAFTATADPATQQTICHVLGLVNPAEFKLSPYRKNLNLAISIAWSPRDRRQQLLRFIQDRPKQSGLIYTRTRRETEELAVWLHTQNHATAAYHAGLSAEERRAIEAAWLSDTIPFVICTSAFGLGMNKPATRWVVHFQPPLLLAEYLQEIGRAGRDGQSADALLLISEPTGLLDPTDQQRRQFLETQRYKHYQTAQALVNQLPRQGEVNTIHRQFPNSAIALAILHSVDCLDWNDPFHYTIRSTTFQLKSSLQSQHAIARAMNQYLTTRECRWLFLLRGFGFKGQANVTCGHCDNCNRREYSRIK